MSRFQAKPATLHDVAHLADVSYQTVSRVINDSPNVSKKTRARVLKAIRALDYRPNRAARSLITRQSQTLQIITTEMGYLGSVTAILLTAKRLGYQVGFSILGEPFHPQELSALLDELTARLVDGFLFISPRSPFSAEDLSRMCRGTPYVMISADPGPQTPSVVYDQRYGMQLILQHLFDGGHRRIAEISGPLEVSDARLRHETYLQFMPANALPLGPSEEANFSIEGGYQAAARLLARGEPPTAMVCGNDNTALGAMRLLAERGFQIPQDVSVTGFDDVPFAAYLNPPLTTVSQDFYVLGKQCVEYLVAMIKDPETPAHQRLLYPQLIIRGSTRSLA